MQVDFKKEFIKLRGESRPMNRKIMDRARALNLPLFSRILKKGRSQLGCSSPRPLDDVESKDMMMCTLLFGALGLKYNHIIQIGGNFGNLPRLIEGIVDYSKWTIVDDPNKIKIQKWFLEQELKINFNKIEFISCNEFSKWQKSLKEADLSIGIHSLSKFSMEDFKDYYRGVIMKCKNLFFVAYKDKVNCKLDLIAKNFSPLGTLYTENESITNTIFQRK